MYLGHVKFYKTYKDESLTIASLVKTTGVVLTYHVIYTAISVV